jgi:hypothetical protein
MPTYDFQNKVTGEVVEKMMKMTEKDEWLAANPDWQQIHTGGSAAIGDPVRLGIRKHDNGFREVLQKIHEKAPGSRLKDNIR